MIQSVPTNVITGFLGVGKTTAILHLLANKPADERWAVLVNEFGEIGVDGALMEQQDEGIFISEVPGGCMCCTSGLPMQIALNMLLTRSKPDRLLIEPTGLGHPKEVIQTLTGPDYAEALQLNRTITLVDPRNLDNPRYTDHPVFAQQIEVADLVVGHKADLCDESDRRRLEDFVSGKSIEFAAHGEINPAWLEGASAMQAEPVSHHHHSHGDAPPLASQIEFPESGWIHAVNQGERFLSEGWRFADWHQFDRTSLRRLLFVTEAERIKGIFITNEGVFAYNAVAGEVKEYSLDEAEESRVELISTQAHPDFEAALLECLV